MTQECKTCRYWQSFTTVKLNEREYVVGFCRRYPPSIVAPKELEKTTKFENPRTLEFNWCGEYNAR